MPDPHDLSLGHEALRALIEYALSEGWDVARSPDGQLTFLKPGLPPVYTGSTTSGHRTARKVQAKRRHRNKWLADVASHPLSEDDHG